jgi:hypothetical protein
MDMDPHISIGRDTPRTKLWAGEMNVYKPYSTLKLANTTSLFPLNKEAPENQGLLKPFGDVQSGF